MARTQTVSQMRIQARHARPGVCSDATEPGWAPASHQNGGQRGDVAIIASVQCELADLDMGIDIARALMADTEAVPNDLA